jgi:hypothetical protein
VTAVVAQPPPASIDAAILPSHTLSSVTVAIDQADAGHDLQVVITPGVWLPRLGGESKLAGLAGASDLTLETDFNLDDLEPSFNFEMAITKGEKWQIDVSGFDFSTDSSGVFDLSGSFGAIAFDPGDAFDASFDMTSVAVGVTCWQWQPIRSGPREDSIGNTSLRFAWGASVRWLDVKQTLDVPGASAPRQQGDGEWVVPAIVVKMDLQFDLKPSFPVIDTVQLLAAGSIGPAIGGDGGVVLTFGAGIRGWVCHNFSLDFGYRLLQANVENDDYQLNGGLQGLFLSGTLRF